MMVREFFPIPKLIKIAVWTPERRFETCEGRLPDMGESDLLFRVELASLQAPETGGGHGHDQPRVSSVVGELAAMGGRVRGWDPLDRGLWSVPLGSDGSLPSHFVVPASAVRRGQLWKVPVEMNAENASLLPEAARAARALREARLPSGGVMLVVGLGLIGQLGILLGRHQKGASSIGADTSATLRRRAEWNGAEKLVHLPQEDLPAIVRHETGGRGVHGALVTRAEGPLIAEAAAALGPGGTLILGSPPEGTAALSINAAKVWAGETRLIGVSRPDARGVRDAMGAFRQGVVDAETLISKRVAWDELGNETWAAEYWEHAIHVVVEGPEEA